MSDGECRGRGFYYYAFSNISNIYNWVVDGLALLDALQD